MSHWLITGGAGFIGSHLVDALVQRKQRVRVFDSLIAGTMKNLEASRGKFDFVRGDIRNVKQLRGALKGIDYVLHQAALRSVVRSIEDPVGTTEVNAQGTLNVLAEAHRAGVKRVVCASSSSVYGSSKKYPQSPSDRPMPLSPYAAAKLAGEHYCRVFSETMGLSTVSLRYFNVFGPRQDFRSRYAVVIPLFMRAALVGKPLPLEGDGTQSRDFAYIDNVVQANLLAATRPAAHAGVFNVACGTTTSLLDYIRLLEKLAGKKLPIKKNPARKGDVKKTFADISLSRRLLGYRPVASFEVGVHRTWDYLKNLMKSGLQ